MNEKKIRFVSIFFAFRMNERDDFSRERKMINFIPIDDGSGVGDDDVKLSSRSRSTFIDHPSWIDE